MKLARNALGQARSQDFLMGGGGFAKIGW